MLETASVSLDSTPPIPYSSPGLGEADGGLLMRANEMDLRPVGNAINVHFLNALAETDQNDVTEVDFYALGDDDSLSGSSPVLSSGYLQGGSIVLAAKSYHFLVTTANSHSILGLAGTACRTSRPGAIHCLCQRSSRWGTPNILSVALQDE